MCCTTVKYNEKYCLNLSSTSSPQPNLKITPSTRNQPLVSCCGLIEHLRTFLESKPELFCRIFWNDWSSVFFHRFFFTSIDPIIIMHTFGGGHHSFRPSECSVSHPSFTYMQGECVNHYTKEILEILRTTVADIKGQIYQIWSPSQFGQRERHLSYSMYFIINFSNAPPLSHFFVQSLILFTTSNNFLVECFFLKGGRLQFKKIVISASQRVCNACQLSGW